MGNSGHTKLCHVIGCDMEPAIQVPRFRVEDALGDGADEVGRRRRRGRSWRQFLACSGERSQKKAVGRSTAPHFCSGRLRNATTAASALAAGLALAFRSAPAGPRRCPRGRNAGREAAPTSGESRRRFACKPPLRRAGAVSVRSHGPAHGNALIALSFSGFGDKSFVNQEVCAMFALIERSGRKGRGEARTG